MAFECFTDYASPAVFSLRPRPGSPTDSGGSRCGGSHFGPRMQDPGGLDPSRLLQPHFFLGRGVVSGKYLTVYGGWVHVLN